MAAVFALVFVPALAAVLFILGAARNDLSLATIAAATIFTALASGTLAGLFRLARSWEDEDLNGP